MAKTAVKVDLVYVDNEEETFRIHAILEDGSLCSTEMYGHLLEGNQDGVLTVYPAILTDETGESRVYTAEWGYGDESHTTFQFLSRPLVVGQEVTRVDTASAIETSYVYRIVRITNLLSN